MEIIESDIEYDLLLQKTKPSSYDIKTELDRKSKENSIILRPTNHIHFVICNSCYWCATYFSIDDLDSSSQVLCCPLWSRSRRQVRLTRRATTFIDRVLQDSQSAFILEGRQTRRPSRPAIKYERRAEPGVQVDGASFLLLNVS